MIKLITFDLWHTLAEKTENNFDFSKEIIKEFQLNKSKQEIKNKYIQIIKTKTWDVKFNAYMEFAKEIGILPTKENILKLLNLKEKFEKNIIVYDFTYPLLKSLKKKEYTIALISNSSIFSKQLLEKETEILKYIDFPIFSYQVQTIKPNPNIYLELQKKTLILGDEILMIGDNMVNDVLTPKNLNWNSLHFNGDYNVLKKDLEKYDIIVE